MLFTVSGQMLIFLLKSSECVGFICQHRSMFFSSFLRHITVFDFGNTHVILFAFEKFTYYLLIVCKLTVNICKEKRHQFPAFDTYSYILN